MKSISLFILLLLLSEHVFAQSKRKVFSPNRNTIAFIIDIKNPKTTQEIRIKIISRNGTVFFDTCLTSHDGDHGVYAEGG